MLTFHLTGELPLRFAEGIEALADELGFRFSKDGIPVKCKKGDALRVFCDGEKVELVWAEPVQFYRALSLIPEDMSSCAVEQSSCFKSVGVMFDMSRNAVLKPEGMKFFLRKMAMMGLNLGMMYTEDTYEVPELPYFGYKRGRLSFSELRELDDYADVFGIELCPCIQTLGHLKKMLHWPAYQHLQDNDSVILADEEESYAVLEQMIRAASAPFRSRRIHLGMDEAHGVGLGVHLRKFGYENPIRVIQRHLERVLAITGKLGLEPMMWSDMFFRLDSDDNDYYQDVMPSQKAAEAVPDGITLFYWDYYNDDPAHYERMFRKHFALGAEIAFAGGIWTWSGPAPDYDETFKICPPALNACREAHIGTVMATMWGDDGAETNLTTALLGMQLYGEYAYTGEYDYNVLKARFARCCHGDAESFRALAQFNSAPSLHGSTADPSNLAKILLYQDPLVQLFEEDLAGAELAEHYAALEEKMETAIEQNREYTLMFTFYKDLARLLKYKCAWHQKAGGIVRSGDRKAAKELVSLIDPALTALEKLRCSYWKLWDSTNKPYGYEIIDVRLGGVAARLSTAGERMSAFASGEAENIPELSERPLPFLKKADGTLRSNNRMETIVSASGYDSI